MPSFLKKRSKKLLIELRLPALKGFAASTAGDSS
jgi:hypothetical protein